MKQILISSVCMALLMVACAKVPFTGRKQTKLLPESQMNAMALTAYKDFLTQNKASTDATQVALVKKVGRDIQKAAELYYTKKGMAKKLNEFKWEFNLVDDETVNAWCMPGGKVVIYTGILPITKNADGLAVVMGHEIAHALAHHGNERMSQQMGLQLGGVALSVATANKPQQTQNIFMQAYGLGAQVGALLPFSRKHESEADEIGLYLMTMAGYNPNEAAPFWQRMSAGGGDRPPEFLSTHPDPAKRAANLKAMIPKAKAYAKLYKSGS